MKAEDIPARGFGHLKLCTSSRLLLPLFRKALRFLKQWECMSDQSLERETLGRLLISLLICEGLSLSQLISQYVLTEKHWNHKNNGTRCQVLGSMVVLQHKNVS
jgi:hypothetical protein